MLEMSHDRNILKSLYNRSFKSNYGSKFEKQFHVTLSFIQRLGLSHELEGHGGCVNCLEWNQAGTQLASGSDDLQVILWDPFINKQLVTLNTGHQGNIFSVKFLPCSFDRTLITAAGDYKIRVHDIERAETIHVFKSHVGRVKRVTTAPTIPYMFWSASEDGTIQEFDLRCPRGATGQTPINLLINLTNYLGARAEAKCVAINPLRNEQLAVGANDPFVRLYDRRKLKWATVNLSDEQDSSHPWAGAKESEIPHSAAQYFVAGHLQTDDCKPVRNLASTYLSFSGDGYMNTSDRKTIRNLATTYLTFSPDGKEILVNLGGEQIYLFDVNQNRPPKRFDPSLFGKLNGVAPTCSSNGYCVSSQVSTGSTKNGISTSNHHISHQGTDNAKNIKRSNDKSLPPHINTLKAVANSLFEEKKYSQAILLYNQAIQAAPNCAILYGNRSAAYMMRGWDGDTYAALRDCHSAIKLDTAHLKAHIRLARCLWELEWTSEAHECLQHFQEKFPDHANSSACRSLDRDIKAALFARTSEKNGNKKNGVTPDTLLSNQEREWRTTARDYKKRYCGHCNTTTDIKEANFFGSNGQYIVAGSDDGSFFVWDKNTSNIVRVLRGDDSIVNCLQPHPYSCMLATSGIDHVVRLWTPRPQDGRTDEREIANSHDAASANQKRMNTDPFEVMLLHMGYRIPRPDSDTTDESEAAPEAPLPCQPS